VTGSRSINFFRLLLVSGLLLLSIVPFASAQETAQSGSALPSLQALKECLKGARSAECLDHLYREALQKHTTLEVLEQVQRFEAQDADLRRDCHPIVHAIGRETYRLKGNIHDAFSACNQTCHSGCYHGSVERFLRGDELYSQTGRHPTLAELKEKAATACSADAPNRLRFQCLHGLGHALMFFSRYQLRPSLEACDSLPDWWSQNSCYGGVFMENAFNATPEKRDLSPTDFHYPCNAVAPKYRRECYLMQTSRMVEMGLSGARLVEECAKAGEHAVSCSLSIGRDLSNDVRVGKTRAVAQECENASADYRIACMRGVIYALIDNTWDGRYAFPFCTAFSEERDQRSCINDAIQYLKTAFDKSAEEITSDCSRHLGRSGDCGEVSPR
jgi:hypothetical protein